MTVFDSTPTKNAIPSNLHSRRQKKDYFDGVVESFVNKYVVKGELHPQYKLGLYERPCHH